MGIFEPNGPNSTRLKSACQEDIVPFGKKIESVVQNVGYWPPFSKSAHARPSLRKASAAARPMPLVPPVITAILPCNRFICETPVYLDGGGAALTVATNRHRPEVRRRS